MDSKHLHIGFWWYAKEFYCAAKKLKQDNNEIKLIIYYLYCHAIELVLKAVLVFRGFQDIELKRIGHDLIRAWNEVVNIEPSFCNRVRHHEKLEDILKLLNPYYKGKEFEYIRQGYKRFPLLDDVHTVAEDLLLIGGEVISIPFAQLSKFKNKNQQCL